MGIAITGTITGTAQTGLTSPGYTASADNNPANNGKQSIITALTGTQTNVTVHSGADPFTVSVFKPLTYRLLSFVTSTVVRRPPRNVWKVVTRKGTTFLTGQPKDVAMMSTLIDLPAGCEAIDSPNIRAMISCHVGLLNGQSANIGDSVLTNSV